MTQNDKRMSLILNSTETHGQLWLGSEQAANDTQLLIQHNIQTIVSVISKNTVKLPEDCSVSQVFYEALDHTSFKLQKYFEPSYEAIEKGRLKEAGVLVHCKAGVSRSASLVIAYLMKSKKWGFEKAFFFVKERRYFINPNLGFRQQLVQYNYYLQQERSKDSVLTENVQRNAKISESMVVGVKSKAGNDSLESKLEIRLTQAIKQHYMSIKKLKEDEDDKCLIKSQSHNFELQQEQFERARDKKHSVLQLDNSHFKKVNYQNVYNNVMQDQLSKIVSPARASNPKEKVFLKKKTYNLINLYDFKN